MSIVIAEMESQSKDDKNPIQQTDQRELPFDVISEMILTRLPIKSIVRFKSVSKLCIHNCLHKGKWETKRQIMLRRNKATFLKILLSKKYLQDYPLNPFFALSQFPNNGTLLFHLSDFANAHLVKSPFYHPSAPVNTLFLKSGKSCYLFSYDDDDDDDNDHISGSCIDNLVKLDVDFGVETEDNFHFTGCCNGLICLTQVPCKCFILWNPATRKFHKYESNGYLKLIEGQIYPCIDSGFGYASSVNDYKYVRILSRLWGEESIIGVHVFSLREKRWRKIDFDIIKLYFLHGVAVLINETLYWVGLSIQQAHYVIVSFDLGTEKFAIFPSPSLESPMIGSMGEYLCKFAFDKPIDILKPPTTVIKSIRLPKCLSLNGFSKMIGYTKTGKFFVMGPFSESGDVLQDGPPSYKMSLVDPGTEPMQYKMLLESAESFNIARYVPSLVSPFPTPT